MPERHLTYLEYKEERAQKEAHWSRRDRVREAVDRGAVARQRGETDHLAALVGEVLVPGLVGRDGREIRRYHQRLDAGEWNPAPLVEFINGQRDRTTVNGAFRALVTIAEHEDMVGDVQNYATAFGFEHCLGRLWSQFEMDVGDEVGLVTRDSGWPKTLVCGKTGRGKSATLDAEVGDRFAAGQKVVDIVDTDEFESALYDVPQKQDVLRKARDELGLPKYQTRDSLPDLEVLVPLTPNSQDLVAPYDGEGTIVRPFTIPAATLDETTVVSLLTAMVSQQQEASIRTAYRELDDENDDWTLADLSDCIADRDDLESKFQQRVLRLLEDLQRRGFIRDHEDEHAIDWEEIFRDTETITAFTVAPMAEETDQFMVISYLVDQLYQARDRLSGLPPAVGVARELHEIVPHRNETSDDRRAEALQKAIASNLSYLMKKNRHVRLELLADTQNVSDLKKGVRKRFSRFVAFKQPADDLKEIFEVLGENGYQSCKKAMPNKAGHGAVIGATRASLSHDLSFLAPVQFAPAGFHHFDVDEHDDGFHARSELLGEELHTVPWDGSVPDRLMFNAVEYDEQTADTRGVVPFAEDCVVQVDGEGVDKKLLYRTYNRYTAEIGVDAYAHNQFSRALGAETELEFDIDNYQKEYRGIALTERGHSYTPDDHAGGAEAPADD